MLAAITIRCAAALPSENNIAAIASRLKLEVRPIVDQMLASIPYFLLADVWSAFRDPPGKLEPRPPVGGILCMHPIYITLLQSEVVSKEIAKYLRGCLKWMSDWQGMGQARVLVEDPGSTIKLNVSDAHTIVWAGMAT